MEIRYIIKLEILAAGSPYNNNIQVSIVEGKIVIFRITSGARLTPDITIPSVHRKNTNYSEYTHSYTLSSPEW